MGAPTGMQTRSRQRGVPAASSRGVFRRSAESRGRCRVAPRRRARSRDAALGFGITEPPCSGRVSVRDGDLLGPLERRRLGGSLFLGEDADNVAWPGAPVRVLPRRRRGGAACPLLTESPAPATPSPRDTQPPRHPAPAPVRGPSEALPAPLSPVIAPSPSSSSSNSHAWAHLAPGGSGMKSLSVLGHMFGSPAAERASRCPRPRLLFPCHPPRALDNPAPHRAPKGGVIT